MDRPDQNRVNRVLESMLGGFLFMDADWRITYLNDAAERILGPRDSLLGGTVWDLFPATVGTEFEQNYRRAAAGETVTFDAYYPAPLDSWFEVRAVPDDGGVALYFLDISERKAAQAALESDARVQVASARDLAQRILDNVADGIFGLDANGRAEFANPATAALTGHSVEELLGQDMHAVLHHTRADGSAYPREECLTYQVLKSGVRSRIHEEVFWRKDGSSFPASVSAVPVHDGKGGTTGVVVSFRDISERVALQEAQLREAAQRRLADRLQQALLTPPPEPDHLHIVVRYSPASQDAQVGGDWYDAFLQPDGATMLVIGDVVGHDGVAAARMGQLRGVLRTVAYSHDSDTPAEVLTRMEHVSRGLGVESMATVLLARVERIPDQPVVGDRILRWSNAGHPPPVMLLRDGSCEVLEAEPDLLIGVDPTSPRQDHTRLLPDGATLVMFTDGLIERRGSSLEDGLGRLIQVIKTCRTLDLNALCDEILSRMSPGAGEDDIALIAVRTYPEDRPRPAEAGPNRLPSTLAGDAPIIS